MRQPLAQLWVLVGRIVIVIDDGVDHLTKGPQDERRHPSSPQIEIAAAFTAC